VERLRVLPAGRVGQSGRPQPYGWKSSNPSLSLGSSSYQSPLVAWEDDSSGSVSVFVKKWPAFGEPGTGWTELAGSASGTASASSSAPPSTQRRRHRQPDPGHHHLRRQWQRPELDAGHLLPFARGGLRPSVAGAGTQIVILVFYPAPRPAQGWSQSPRDAGGFPPAGTRYGDPGAVSTSFFNTFTGTLAGFVSQYPLS